MALPTSAAGRIVSRFQPYLLRYLSTSTTNPVSSSSTTTSPSSGPPHSFSSPVPSSSSSPHDGDGGDSREKRYVRIAGPASYASRDDIALFLHGHGVGTDSSQNIVQGQSDVFQNHSVWLIETGSQREATNIANKISGRVLGLKLIRAAAVDQKLYDGLLAPSESGGRSLRKRLSIIAPKKEERGHCLLARNLPQNLYPRVLWSFFSAYEVVDIRHLRRSGVACIVFDSEMEANRALRERKNVPLQRQFPLSLKIHE